MPLSCTNPDCTVAATNKCLLLHEPPESCPNINKTSVAAPALTPVSAPEAPQPSAEVSGRVFHAGFELGTIEAAEIMSSRYGTLIAVLGQYDVGKTCFLASLYLLCACQGTGTNLRFAGSLTLNGFEARARRLRKWKDGALPDQLADHTVLAEPRTPAIMHLALREADGDRARYELLLTDLPGEWSTNLVKDVSTADRFAFIHRADGIVIGLDGPVLAGPERHGPIDNAKHLLTRLAKNLKVDLGIPLVLMVNKCDELGMKVPKQVQEIVDHAEGLGFSPVVKPVAAISRTPAKVPSGSGVMDVIEYFLDRNGERAASPKPPNAVGYARHFARIRP